MTKRYKMFLESMNINEAPKSFTPQFGKTGDSKDMTRARKGMLKDLNPDVEGSIAKVITDTIKDLPKKYDRIKNDPKVIKDIINMASRAVGAVERDKEGKPINVTSKDGMGVASSNFEKLSIPYQALYLLLASKMSPNNAVLSDYDTTLPFKIINEIIGSSGGDVDIADLKDNDIRTLLKHNDSSKKNSTEKRKSVLADFMDNLLKISRENNPDSSTLLGREAGGSNIDTKGHGRLKSLVQTLIDIDRDYFKKNRNASGQNYGGVKDTNQAIEEFVKSMVTQKTKKNAVNSVVSKAKDEYQATQKDRMSELLDRLNPTDGDKAKAAIAKLDNTISRLSDPAKIYDVLTNYIKTGDDTQKIRKAVQSYYTPLRKAVKKGNVSIDNLETPVKPSFMKEILDKIYEVDAEAVHAPQLNSFIEKNYSQYPDVVKHYYKLLKHSGATDYDPEGISRDDAIKVGSEIGVPVSVNNTTPDSEETSDDTTASPIDISNLKTKRTLSRAEKKQKEQFMANAKKNRLSQGLPIDDDFLQRAEDHFMKRLDTQKQESFLNVMMGMNKLLDEYI